jgi:hypothetical protein
MRVTGENPGVHLSDPATAEIRVPNHEDPFQVPLSDIRRCRLRTQGAPLTTPSVR